MELVHRGSAARLPCRCGVERINVVRFRDRNDHRPVRPALDVKWLGVNVAGDGAVEVQVARQVRCGGKRERSVNVNAVPGRIVVFLRDVNLRVASTPLSTAMQKTATTDLNRIGLQAFQVCELEVHRRVI